MARVVLLHEVEDRSQRSGRPRAQDFQDDGICGSPGLRTGVPEDDAVVAGQENKREREKRFFNR